jgi:hypothetical protein
MGLPPAMDGWPKRGDYPCALSKATITSMNPSTTAHDATLSGRGPTRSAIRGRGRRRDTPELDRGT